MSDVRAFTSAATPARTTRLRSRETEGAAFPRFVTITLMFSLPLIVGLSVILAPLEALDVLLVTLFALNTLWVAAAAATALIGVAQDDQPKNSPPIAWTPKARTAVLFLICGEDPLDVARRMSELHRGLVRAGQTDVTDIWLLSDTPNAKAQPEESAIARLRDDEAIRYRRRTENTARKPGNIANWIDTFGAPYTSMLIMDADSTVTVERLNTLRYKMERAPRLGLLQSGIALRPGATRFARLQRLSARLTGPVYIRGLKAWSGATGNYWGHNALIRLDAFREVMRLPRLSGPAPFGGDFLSHDFIEAAMLVRNGWDVEIMPETHGSSEAGPEDLESFHRRDRRWCQGNLQHLRPLFSGAVHPISRIHLASGIQSYLSSPIWLTLMLLFLLAGMAPGAVPVLSGALALLLVPKLA
ncbi:MAG: glucans biosynthesis glucosyltransferase MdoH, partial [Pseudomonadota bacterium]